MLITTLPVFCPEEPTEKPYDEVLCASESAISAVYCCGMNFYQDLVLSRNRFFNLFKLKNFRRPIFGIDNCLHIILRLSHRFYCQLKFSIISFSFHFSGKAVSIQSSGSPVGKFCDATSKHSFITVF